MRVLISLTKGYGLGDAVQASVVLQHIRKFRPEWRVDFQAEEGYHQVGRGIVENTFAYGQPYHKLYDIEERIVLYNKWYNYTDRPNTHVCVFLKERMGIDWSADCGRYRIQVPRQKTGVVPVYEAAVAVHAKGRTATDRKDLSDRQIALIGSNILDRGWRPLFLSGNSTDIGSICTLISRCEAFVGIDSGPAKCASATKTPSLVVWTGHHPAMYHDPSPNTTHLVPENYKGLLPVVEDHEVIRWFEANYRVRFYKEDPVEEVRSWLRETLV